MATTAEDLIADTEVKEARRRLRAIVEPTFIQNWPEALKALSMPSLGWPLSDGQRDALIAATWATDGEDPPQDAFGSIRPDETRAQLDGLQADIDRKIGELRDVRRRLDSRGEFFVRLGSRSPKDSWYGIRNGFGVREGRKALRILMDSTERIHDDLVSDRLAGSPSWIFLREWIDIPDWAEFRCVLRGGAYAGASQYACRDGQSWPILAGRREEIAAALEVFCIKVSEAVAHRTAERAGDLVVDVGFVDGRLERPVLVEINPFLDLTDPCLFNGGWPAPGTAPEFRFIGDGRDYGIVPAARARALAGGFLEKRNPVEKLRPAEKARPVEDRQGRAAETRLDAGDGPGTGP